MNNRRWEQSNGGLWMPRAFYSLPKMGFCCCETASGCGYCSSQSSISLVISGIDMEINVTSVYPPGACQYFLTGSVSIPPDTLDFPTTVSWLDTFTATKGTCSFGWGDLDLTVDAYIACLTTHMLLSVSIIRVGAVSAIYQDTYPYSGTTSGDCFQRLESEEGPLVLPLTSQSTASGWTLDTSETITVAEA